MIRTPARLALTVALPLVALAACGAPQDCDPRRDTSIFKVGACVINKDGYQARVDRLNQELRIVEQDLKDADQDRRAADARRDTAAARAATLRGDLATQRQRSLTLERRIAETREGTQADRQLLGQLEQDLVTLRAQQDRLREAPAGAQQQQQLQDLRRQEESLERQFDDISRMAPRR